MTQGGGMTSTTEKTMRHSTGRLAGFARAVAFVLLAAATAAPAAAQIGGIKKKVRAAAGAPEAADKGAKPATAAQAGTLVLTDEVLDRFIAGLRTGRAAREAEAKKDTPYGRHVRAQAAYAAAKPKCDAAAQTWPQRMAANQALMEKSNALLEKMMAAQQKQDTVLQRVYADSMLAMQDPSCTVKQPHQPGNWFDLQREVDGRVEQEELKASGFDQRELGAVRDRVLLILENAPLPDKSPSEQAAVDKRANELNRLMGRAEAPTAPAAQPAAAAAAPPPQPTGPAMSPDQAAMTDCMAKNAKKHEKEIERLGKRAQAAAESGNTQAAMVIADSIGKLQMAGCSGN
jgi:hypothetical protein